MAVIFTDATLSNQPSSRSSQPKKKKSYYTFYWAVQQLGIPKLVIQHPSDRVKFEHWNWKAVYLLLQVFTKYLIEFF